MVTRGCSVCFVYMLFYVLLESSNGLIRYDRAELIRIRDNLPLPHSLILDLPPNFPRGRPKHQPRKRGKRAGATSSARRHRCHRLALPSLTLFNVRSLANNKDKLTSLILSQRDFRDCASICLTETSLHTNIPDSVLQQEGCAEAAQRCLRLYQPELVYRHQNSIVQLLA